MSNLPSTPASTATFRDLSDAISPVWLNGPVGQAYRYSMAIQFDTLYDAFTYGLRSRFPSLAPDDALPWLAEDRLIDRGPSESEASYRARLQQWLDLWRLAGNPTSVLLGLNAYFLPSPPKILTVQSAGFGILSDWETYEAGAQPFPPSQTYPTLPEHYLARPANWNWDGLSAPFYYPWMWWRAWVVIFSPGGDPYQAPTQTWDDGSHWDDGHCWDIGGLNVEQEAISLRKIVSQWQAADCWIPWILIAYDATMFDETLAFGSSKLPDGHWGRWGKVISDPTYGSVYVAARPDNSKCAFIAGTTASISGAW